MHPNWVVITGAPSSGKTTLLKELEARGYRCAPEPARAYMESELAKGRPLQEIRGDTEHLERRIKEWERATRADLPKDELVFVDTVTDVDGLPYLRWHGMEPSASWLDDARANWFGAVYLLDLLPFEQDGIRTENEIIVAFIDRELEKFHKLQGYPLKRVPVLPIAARADFILEDLQAAGLLPVARERAVAPSKRRF